MGFFIPKIHFVKPLNLSLSCLNERVCTIQDIRRQRVDSESCCSTNPHSYSKKNLKKLKLGAGCSLLI